MAGSIFDGVAMALNSEEASFVDNTVSYLDCYLIFKAQTDFSDGEAQALSKLLEGPHKYQLAASAKMWSLHGITLLVHCRPALYANQIVIIPQDDPITA